MNTSKVSKNNSEKRLRTSGLCVMEAYFQAHSEKGRIATTQHIMDNLYASELTFDEGIINGREQWYKACLAHPGVQDKIALEHLAVYEKQKEVIDMDSILGNRSIDAWEDKEHEA
ncbi:MAG TPA: hypothetical protein VMG30_05930 [Acidobacteriota bacterium]|nr:hypothetical protein [Acidobacteriota bacterium]